MPSDAPTDVPSDARFSATSSAAAVPDPTAGGARAVDPALARAVAGRGVTRVCHLTQARKFSHIVASADGVLSTAALRAERRDVLDQNDPRRLDRKDTHISCSIEYPNTHYLRQVRARERVFPDWVVLLIDPVVLTWADTYFAPCNAAACVERHATGVAGFDVLYAPSIAGGGGRVWRRTPSRLAASPTDDQAEVLVGGAIPRSLIRAVAAATAEQAALERSRLALIPGAADVRWLVAPAFFDGSWGAEVRAGRRPSEHWLDRGVNPGDTRDGAAGRRRHDA